MSLTLKCCGVNLLNREKCRCKSLTTIQIAVRKWYNTIQGLEEIEIKKNRKINFKSICAFFEIKGRSKNDESNKVREAIIMSIYNKKVPSDYYKYSIRWSKINKELQSYIKQLCEMKNITQINSIHCEIKAGRNYKYDFDFLVNNKETFCIEFKNNASNLNSIPQFVSPMKPSQYFNGCYEDHYYDNYFRDLTLQYNLPIPEKEDYLKQIHFTNPKCLIEHQIKYYRGCKSKRQYSGEENDIEFYNNAKKAARDSISSFMNCYDLNKEKLTDYLLKTQKNKHYMLHSSGTFYLDTIHSDNFIITDIEKKPDKNMYIAKTKGGDYLSILIRWKNGNGIALPALQIGINRKNST